MTNRHILRGDGGVRTMCSANHHHLCGWAPGIQLPSAFSSGDYLITMNSGLLDQLL